MRQQLLDLHEIQKIDVEIREIETKNASVSQKLAQLEGSANALRTEVQSLTEQRENIVREIKTLEGMVQAEALKVKKWEARLNEIRNQREYLALSREVEGSKRQNREAEEKILELMAQRDQIDKKLDELQDKLAEEEVDCASERATVERVTKDTNERVDAMKKRRDVLLPKIPRPLMKKYDAIRQKRLGIGLVTVVDGCCQGCNMKLPPQLYNILQRGDSLEQCPSCQRIIFWDHFLADRDAAAKKGAEGFSVTRRRKEPDARQIIRFIAEQESLALTADEFPGTSEERIRQILREFLTEGDVESRSRRSKEAVAEPTDTAPALKVEVYTDGAARGNPGPAGAGWVIKGSDGVVIKSGHAFLGRRTNNEAEYEAVIRALREATTLGARDVALRSDSELLIRQINGQYRVREPRLEEMHRTARQAMQCFRRFEVRHVPREQNADADAEANRAIDEGEPPHRAAG